MGLRLKELLQGEGGMYLLLQGEGGMYLLLQGEGGMHMVHEKTVQTITIYCIRQIIVSFETNPLN